MGRRDWAGGSCRRMGVLVTLLIDGRKILPIGFTGGPPPDGRTPEGKPAFEEIRDAGGTFFRTGLQEGDRDKQLPLRSVLNRFRDHPGLPTQSSSPAHSPASTRTTHLSLVISRSFLLTSLFLPPTIDRVLDGTPLIVPQNPQVFERSETMGILKEFRDFAVKGNALDMAVGIIIGAAFNKIVTSLVNDVIMPPIGMLLGGVDFKNLQVVLKGASTLATGEAVPAVAVRYGLFLNTVIDFLIVAFTIFMVVRTLNRLTRLRATPAA